MDGYVSDTVGAKGSVQGWRELVDQVSCHNYDALAIASRISVNKKVAINYLKNGGINPWGGVEAMASKLIANEINKPVAHAPVETEDADIRFMNEVSPPRNAAEMLSMAFIHCVFKGLHKAPRINMYSKGLFFRDIDCLITPYQCFGPPHEACLDNNIPIIAVKNNTTCLDINVPDDKCYLVNNYIEAAGIAQCIKEGLNPEYV